MSCKSHGMNDTRPIRALKIDMFDMDRGVIGLCLSVCEKCGKQFVITQTLGNNHRLDNIYDYPKKIEWIEPTVNHPL